MQQQVAQSDRVVTQMVLRAVYKGSIGTSRSPQFVSTVCRSEKIAEHWSVADMAGLMQQIASENGGHVSQVTLSDLVADGHAKETAIAKGATMPKFLTIGYGDEAGYTRTPPAVRDAAHEHDARLRNAGAIISTAGSPIQVQNPGAQGIRTSSGAFMRSDLPVAGFALIEASDIDAAIAAVAQTPCAIAYGVVEIWPLDPTP